MFHNDTIIRSSSRSCDRKTDAGALATCQHVQRRALSLSSTSAGRAAILGRSWTRRLGAAFPIQRAGIEPSIIGTASYPVLKVDSFDYFLSNCACSIAHAQV